MEVCENWGNKLYSLIQQKNQCYVRVFADWVILWLTKDVQVLRSKLFVYVYIPPKFGLNKILFENSIRCMNFFLRHTYRNLMSYPFRILAIVWVTFVIFCSLKRYFYKWQNVIFCWFFYPENFLILMEINRSFFFKTYNRF